MSNIRDIINAATPGPWKWGEYDHLEHYGEPFMYPECSCGCYKYERGFYDTSMGDSNKRFIETFDPEHVALMEAEHRAVEKYFVAFDSLRVVVSLGDAPPTMLRMAHREMDEARAALKAAHESIPTYRKERGWE